MSERALTLKLFAACALAALALLGGCRGAGEAERAAAEMTGGGDPQRGRAAVERYGCGTCHTIPGVRGAEAQVGPPLDRIAGRMYLGGVLTNSPDNMMRWIRDPRAVDPLTAMPTLGVNDRDARDIASFLYTLK
jgi:cytochrome c2